MKNDILFYMWTIFFISLPIAVDVFYMRISYFVFIMLFLFFLMSSSIDIKNAIFQLKSPLALPGAIFLLIIVFSIFQSRFIPANSYIIDHSILNYPWIKSISHIILLFLLTIIFLAVIFFIDTKEKLKKVVIQYGKIATIFSVFSLLIFFLNIFFGVNIHGGTINTVVDIPGDNPRLVSLEQEPLFLGLYLITSLSLLCSLLFTEKNKKWIFFAITIVIITLFLTQSRSAILGFIFAAIIFLFQYKCECKQIISQTIKKVISSKFLIFIIISLLIIITTTSVVYNTEIITFTKPIITKSIIVPIIGAFDSSYGKFVSTQTRFIMSHYALEAFQQHPWLGVGYENYNFYTGQRYYYGLYDFNLNWPEVNNYPLKVLTELGIVGMFCFVILNITFYYTLLKAISHAKDIFLKNLLNCFFACSVYYCCFTFFF